MRKMDIFVVQITYDSYRKKIGILLESKDENEARNIAQKHFLNTHPDDSILFSEVVKVDVTLIDINPSKRNPEKKI
jgi:hypothetical protein